jgi:hypothetical protein
MAKPDDNDRLHFLGAFEFDESHKGAFVAGYVNAMHLIGSAFLAGAPQPLDNAQARRANRFMIQTHLAQAHVAWEELQRLSERGPKERDAFKLFDEGDIN